MCLFVYGKKKGKKGGDGTFKSISSYYVARKRNNLQIMSLDNSQSLSSSSSFPRIALNIYIHIQFPSAILHKGFPPDKIDLSDYIKGRSVIVVGLPGAFTPT